MIRGPAPPAASIEFRSNYFVMGYIGRTSEAISLIDCIPFWFEQPWP
jgi:hypothetical protein